MRSIIALVLLLTILSPFSIYPQIVGYWNFNETRGNTVYDASGFNNDGYAHQLSRISDGYNGDGRSLPNERDAKAIVVKHSSSLNVKGAITLQCYIKIQQYETTGLAFIRKNESYGLLLGSYGSQGFLQFLIDPFILQSDQQVPLNEWVHVAGTWNGSTAKLFINHREVKSQRYNGTINTSRNDLWLGGLGRDMALRGSVLIDEVAIIESAVDPNNFIK